MASSSNPSSSTQSSPPALRTSLQSRAPCAVSASTSSTRPIAAYLSLPAAQSAQVKEAFHVSRNLYSYRGKTLRAHAGEPSVPPALKDVVTYIAGLDDSRKLMRPRHVSRVQMLAHASSPSSVSAPQQLQPPYRVRNLISPRTSA